MSIFLEEYVSYSCESNRACVFVSPLVDRAELESIMAHRFIRIQAVSFKVILFADVFGGSSDACCGRVIIVWGNHL